MLQAIDMLWVEHLEAMDYMRSSVRLRAYGQKDPLVEYKNEGRGLFVRMEASIDNAIAEMALKVGGQMNEPKQEPVLEIHNSGSMIGKVSTNLASSGLPAKWAVAPVLPKRSWAQRPLPLRSD